MRTLGIITARSGSKGIKDKNIKDLNGKPLVAYTIENALQSKYIDEVMVSTDSTKYAELSEKYGAKVPFLRSAENSTDTASSLNTIFEVLDKYEKLGYRYENVIMLQPTSPLRTYHNINEAFKIFYGRKADSVVSVCECEHSPLLSNILPDDLNMYEFIKSKNNLRRQDLRKFYRLNGAIYISKVPILKKIKSFYGEKSYAYIMERRESVDIDTKQDFEYAEFLLKKEMLVYEQIEKINNVEE